MCMCICDSVGPPKWQNQAPVLTKCGTSGGIKEISLGNNNHYTISVAAKIILLSSVGCLMSKMGVNPLTFLSCLCENCWLSSANTRLAFRCHEQQTRDVLSCLTHFTDWHQSHQNNRWTGSPEQKDKVMWWLIFRRSSIKTWRTLAAG